VGDIYSKGVSFGTPTWVSLVAVRVAGIATGVSCVCPVFMFKKALAGWSDFAKTKLPGFSFFLPLAPLLLIPLMRVTGPP